jgi:hypothetical protein
MLECRRFALYAQPMTCGDLSSDNRPNICQRKVDDTWVTFKSSCTKISDTEYEYESCTGSKLRMTGDDLTCLASSDCPGATYIGRHVQ